MSVVKVFSFSVGRTKCVFSTIKKMVQKDHNKLLILGVVAGAAGLTVAVVWYRRRKGRRGEVPPPQQPSSKAEPPATRDVAVDGGGSRPLHPAQAHVVERLAVLIHCVSELKQEVHSLKSTFPRLKDRVRTELRDYTRTGERSAHRTGSHHKSTPAHEQSTAGGGTSTESQSSEEAESEGGYMTALTDSEDDEPGDGYGGWEKEDDLSALLKQADSLHVGSNKERRAGLAALLERTEEFGQKSQFLWRLTRAYCDAHDVTSATEEKKLFAETGKTVGAEAIMVNPMCAQSHQWYAVMCGLLAEHESIQDKIKNGYLFKEHLEKAIELSPRDPLSHYLLGRWCYAVAQLSWIERKVAAALFGEPPSATIQDALHYFLKVEEISPNYSKFNFVFLAKCYRELGERNLASKMCEAASTMPTISTEDGEAQKELDALILSVSV